MNDLLELRVACLTLVPADGKCVCGEKLHSLQVVDTDTKEGDVIKQCNCGRLYRRTPQPRQEQSPVPPTGAALMAAWQKWFGVGTCTSATARNVARALAGLGG